jgi:hypothetical protein
MISTFAVKIYLAHLVTPENGVEHGLITEGGFVYRACLLFERVEEILDWNDIR